MNEQAFTKKEITSLTKIVDYFSRRFAAHYNADVQDMQQDAWVAIMQAKSSWDPDKSAKFTYYAGKAICRSLYGKAMKNKSIVSLSYRKKLRLKELAATVSVYVDNETQFGASQAATPEENVISMQTSMIIRDKIKKAAKKSHSKEDVAMDAFFTDHKSMDIADIHKCDRSKVSLTRLYVKRILKADNDILMLRHG